jgi:hypothetical protein
MPDALGRHYSSFKAERLGNFPLKDGTGRLLASSLFVRVAEAYEGKRMRAGAKVRRYYNLANNIPGTASCGLQPTADKTSCVTLPWHLLALLLSLSSALPFWIVNEWRWTT